MIVTRIRGVKDSLRFRLAEWMLAGIMLSWGSILLLPYRTFDEPTFSAMSNMAPESVWGFGCMFIGGIRLAVLIRNGAWYLNSEARAVMAFVSCFVWLQITFGLLKSNVVVPGLAIYPIFLITDGFLVFRAMRDARIIREAVKQEPASNGVT